MAMVDYMLIRSAALLLIRETVEEFNTEANIRARTAGDPAEVVVKKFPYIPPIHISHKFESSTGTRSTGCSSILCTAEFFRKY